MGGGANGRGKTKLQRLRYNINEVRELAGWLTVMPAFAPKL